MVEMWTLGLLAALLVFWSLGAYNRVVRLRSEALAAFPALDQQFTLMVALVRAHFSYQSLLEAGIPARSNGGKSDEHGGANSAKVGADLMSVWAGLLGANEQFALALQLARPRPLHTEGMAALALAQQTLLNAWLRLQQLAADRGETLLSLELAGQWFELVQQCTRLQQVFNQQVSAYNQAIDQFPAAVLARLFGFKPAQAL